MMSESPNRDEFGCDANGYREDGSRIFVSHPLPGTPGPAINSPSVPVSPDAAREVNRPFSHAQFRAKFASMPSNPVDAAHDAPPQAPASVITRTKATAALPIVVAILLLCGAIFVDDNPYGYYTFLRWFACGVSVLLAVSAGEDELPKLTLALWANAILYNPFVRIHLDRETWPIFNAASIILFATFAQKSPSVSLPWKDVERRKKAVSVITVWGRRILTTVFVIWLCGVVFNVVYVGWYLAR